MSTNKDNTNNLLLENPRTHMYAQVCERERLDFQKTTTKKNLYPLEFFLSPHHINSCLFFFSSTKLIDCLTITETQCFIVKFI